MATWLSLLPQSEKVPGPDLDKIRSCCCNSKLQKSSSGAKMPKISKKNMYFNKTKWNKMNLSRYYGYVQCTAGVFNLF